MEFISYLTSDQKVVRELVNGMWFILGVELCIVLILYLMHTMIQENFNVIAWRARIEVKMAIGLCVYMVGSTMRAGWVWMLLECQNRTMTGCQEIGQAYEIMFIAGAFAIVGGLCSVAVTTIHWTRWSALPAGIIAIGIPVVIHFAV